MTDPHADSLRQYINDVIGMERDIVNAIRGQLEDQRLSYHAELKTLLEAVAAKGESRLERFKHLADAQDGTVGAALKEGVMAVTGSLAGIYSKLREHPVSRMLRDDITATTVAATAYGMLLTLSIGTGHGECAALAEEGLNDSASFTMGLARHLSLVVASELAHDAPLPNPAAAQIAGDKIHAAWSQ